jgi:hypothetical protein
VLDLDRMAVAVAELLWTIVREFVLTMLVCVAVGGVLAYLSFLVLRKDPPAAMLAVVLVCLQAQAAGILLGTKRAIVMPLARAVARLKLGQVAVKAVFQRLLPSVDGATVVGSAAWATRQLNRLPLAQVEQGLSRSITELLAAPAGGFGPRAWFRRVVQQRLLRGVQQLTLARFRKEGAQGNAIDFDKVRQDLEGNADELLLGRLTAGLRLWTWVIALGLPLLAVIQVLLLLPFAR